ncbi:c-type cytochrome [Methylocystis sp. WRRC1]|uniref:cytochrome-c peroxidase n=1 Tax=unclassified Methylocystis TaxID=2625913 RepID=UPI0001F86802|nr:MULTISPECIES: cytochrome c peroxidase [unclassified Methylocystis]MCC3245332.1 c-type cytochrome [Methylocystis sp. WRRC1]
MSVILPSLRGARRLALCCLLSFIAVEAKAQNANAGENGLTPVELLGKRIFEDTSLSRPAGVSCASCHDATKAFQGVNGSPIAAVARGSLPTSFGKRNTPTIMYASFAPPFSFVEEKDEESGKVEMVPVGGQFLDGRASDLLAQFEGPLLDPLEMNAPSKRFAVEAIRDGAYADLARKVYGEKIFDDPDAAFEKLAQAVVAFESSARFHPFASKFDDYLRGQAQLTATEKKGFELFKDPKKGNCLACHVGKEDSREPKDWLFTDFTYDALGAPRNRAIPVNAGAGFFDLGLCKRPGLDKIAPAGFDAASVCGAFKVPTLRNIAVTGPYLHNGVFTSLRDVVAFYATRDTDPARWYPKGEKGKPEKFDDLPSNYRENVNVKEAPYDRKPGQKPRLSDKEIDAIVAFLETLTDHPQQ